jgi:hypothetical protein
VRALVTRLLIVPTALPYFTLNDPLATNGTKAYGINDMGQIVGDYSTAGGIHGFLESGSRSANAKRSGRRLSESGLQPRSSLSRTLAIAGSPLWPPPIGPQGHASTLAKR